MSKSVSGNAVKGRVVFVDAAGIPTDPDGEVIWKAYDRRHQVVGEAVTQTVAEKVAVGTFEWIFLPEAPGTYFVEALATVGGIQQCGRQQHEATWVD